MKARIDSLEVISYADSSRLLVRKHYNASSLGEIRLEEEEVDHLLALLNEVLRERLVNSINLLNRKER